jgi:hypothetical protein
MGGLYPPNIFNVLGFCYNRRNTHMHGMFDLLLEIHTRVHLVYQISDFFGVPENSIHLISGLTSRKKIIEIQNISRLLLNFSCCDLPEIL